MVLDLRTPHAVFSCTAIAALLALSIGLSGCTKVQDFEVRGISGMSLDLAVGAGDSASPRSDIEVLIYNPNSFSVRVSALDLQVFLEGHPVGVVDLPAQNELPAGAESVATLSVVWDQRAVLKVASSNALTWLINGAQVRVTGTASGRASIFPHTVYIDHQQRVRLEDLKR
jgi:LEA14-like dessication related protein